MRKFSSTIYSFNALKSVHSTSTSDQSNGSLFWKWNRLQHHTFVYLLFVILLIILFYQGLPNSRLAKIMSVLTFVTWYMTFIKYKNFEIHGRFWCFYVAFIPLALLLYIQTFGCFK